MEAAALPEIRSGTTCTRPSPRPSFGDLVEALQNGKALLLLCDTIYGLVAKAPDAYLTLQQIKGRPEEKPFVQLFADREHLAKGPWQLPPERLQQYWPGPLTCVLAPKAEHRAYLKATRPYCWQDSQAVRIPDHHLLQELCRSCATPLYSTSANRSGRPLPSSVDALRRVFAPEIAARLVVPYLPTESIRNTVASTVVDARYQPPQILRQGACVIDWT